jgi:hypothetical protein
MGWSLPSLKRANAVKPFRLPGVISATLGVFPAFISIPHCSNRYSLRPETLHFAVHYKSQADQKSKRNFGLNQAFP